MKPHIQKIPLSEHSSFMADTFFTPYFETPWHCHSELELVLILKGHGKRFVGNHVSDYGEGSVTFLGANLPHLFRKDNSVKKGGSLVIHFKEAFLGNEFTAIPEMQKIRPLLERSRMGLHIVGTTRDRVAVQMNGLLKLKGMERLIALLQLLTMLSESSEYEILSSPHITGQNVKENGRLNKVFDYVVSNFTEPIQIEDVAKIANMSYSGFSRYFKNRTKKTFTHFVNEIRIGHACKRLMEEDVSISSACFESGFNNLTHFNEQFKKMVRLTPYQFKLQNRV